MLKRWNEKRFGDWLFGYDFAPTELWGLGIILDIHDRLLTLMLGPFMCGIEYLGRFSYEPMCEAELFDGPDMW